MFAWVDELCSRCVFVSVCGLCVSCLGSVSVTVATSSWAESVIAVSAASVLQSHFAACVHTFSYCPRPLVEMLLRSFFLIIIILCLAQQIIKMLCHIKYVADNEA